jgi:hypothetical protein
MSGDRLGLWPGPTCSPGMNTGMIVHSAEHIVGAGGDISVEVQTQFIHHKLKIFYNISIFVIRKKLHTLHSKFCDRNQLKSFLTQITTIRKIKLGLT